MKTLIKHNISILVPRLPAPASPEELAHLKHRKRMCFGVEHDVRQWQQLRGRKEQVEVFECFGLGGGFQGLAHGTMTEAERKEERKKSLTQRTIQKLSMLSLVGGGIWLTSLILLNPLYFLPWLPISCALVSAFPRVVSSVSSIVDASVSSIDFRKSCQSMSCISRKRHAKNPYECASAQSCRSGTPYLSPRAMSSARNSQTFPSPSLGRVRHR
jgi:hypothetical protein